MDATNSEMKFEVKCRLQAIESMCIYLIRTGNKRTNNNVEVFFRDVPQWCLTLYFNNSLWISSDANNLNGI